MEAYTSHVSYGGRAKTLVANKSNKTPKTYTQQTFKTKNKKKAKLTYVKILLYTEKRTTSNLHLTTYLQNQRIIFF